MEQKEAIRKRQWGCLSVFLVSLIETLIGQWEGIKLERETDEIEWDDG